MPDRQPGGRAVIARACQAGVEPAGEGASCTLEGHTLIRTSYERFASATTFAGVMDWILDGERHCLELRHCPRCHSTLAWRVFPAR